MTRRGGHVTSSPAQEHCTQMRAHRLCTWPFSSQSPRLETKGDKQRPEKMRPESDTPARVPGILARQGGGRHSLRARGAAARYNTRHLVSPDVQMGHDRPLGSGRPKHCTGRAHSGRDTRATAQSPAVAPGRREWRTRGARARGRRAPQPEAAGFEPRRPGASSTKTPFHFREQTAASDFGS